MGEEGGCRASATKGHVEGMNEHVPTPSIQCSLQGGEAFQLYILELLLHHLSLGGATGGERQGGRGFSHTVLMCEKTHNYRVQPTDCAFWAQLCACWLRHYPVPD
jgi:hypothetical protein